MSPELDALAVTIDGYLLRLGVDGEPTDTGFWTVRFGSTMVVLSTFTEAGVPYVRLASIVLVGARPSLALLTRLLRMNNEALFGAFQLFDDDTVAFTHTLRASDLDFPTFESALLYVARVGDDHDEELQALAGGERTEEVLEADRRPG
jgi:hypothetical protein